MRLPSPRGPLTAALRTALRGAVGPFDPPVPDDARPEDDALALWMIHELHYRGFEDVDDHWEWSPALVAVQQRLERDLERRLRRRFSSANHDRGAPLVEEIEALIAEHDGPSLARHVQRHATEEQTRALLRQRSLYHLKEADPTSWVIPRLESGPKAALLQVQYDEYGVGDPSRVHQELFRRGLAAAGLNDSYGAYVDEAVLPVLEQNNALSMFGLHRRLRGAALGHLAAFEATSSLPSRQLAQGLSRLGFPAELVAYYDEHVEADAVHEQLALRDICEVLVEAEPRQRDEVLLGVWTCLDLETRTATALLDSWEAAA